MEIFLYVNNYIDILRKYIRSTIFSSLWEQEYGKYLPRP
jgi:hypothetical protein